MVFFINLFKEVIKNQLPHARLLDLVNTGSSGRKQTESSVICQLIGNIFVDNAIFSASDI